MPADPITQRHHPARTNGIYPRKGTLMPGADADIAIWDPNRRWTLGVNDLHMATDYTPYEGMTITGKVETTLVHGRVVTHDGEIIDATAQGRHIEADPINLTPQVLNASRPRLVR